MINKFIVLVSIVTILLLMSCFDVVGDNPANKIIDFNPKEARVGDIITFEVELVETQKNIDSLSQADEPNFIEFTALSNDYSGLEGVNIVYANDIISISKTEIKCRVPEGAITGEIMLGYEYAIDATFTGKYIIIIE